MIALALTLLLFFVVAAIWFATTEDFSSRGFQRPRLRRSLGEPPIWNAPESVRSPPSPRLHWGPQGRPLSASQALTLAIPPIGLSGAPL